MTIKLILAAALAASPLLAQGLAYPAGLQPGDQYRVLFVTDSARDATATYIGDYDAFVTADADAVPFLASLQTNWYAVGSTATVSAKDHTGTVGGGGVPIFRPDGVRIADDYGQLWGAGTTPLLAPPRVTASGAVASGPVWTGTLADGSTAAWPLGGVAQQSVLGTMTDTTYWVSGATQTVGNSYRLYGISDVMTVPYPDYPRDLKPGDSFRILFVTDATRDATSANIADYDAFVTDDALAAPAMRLFGTNWRAVAGTASVAAKVHTDTAGSGVPIYRPDGTRVSDDYATLWAGLGGSGLLASPNVTASGAVTSGQVWTGSTTSGGNNTRTLGDASGVSVSGTSIATDYAWVFTSFTSNSTVRALYGISDVITVPEPEHPADLQPGDQYRVLVVTHGTRDATSANIADYDDFVRTDVNAVAAMRLYDTDWRAVASTASVGARVHTDTVGTGVPIYRPDGVRIANDSTHLWTTSFNNLAACSITSRGLPTQWSRVWTGTHPTGIAATTPLGDASGLSRNGDPAIVNYAWIWSNDGAQTTQWPLYGISAVITVPFPAVEQSRVGTPPNADALLPGQTSGPVIGQTWDPIVDHSAFVTNALIDVLFFGEAQANVPLPGFGTVLVDQLLGSNLVALPGQAFGLSIPDNASLLGVSVSTQALSLDVAWGMHLSNALDITIGSR